METVKFLFKLALCFVLSGAVAIGVGAFVYEANNQNEVGAIFLGGVIGFAVLVTSLRSILTKNNPTKAIAADIESLREATNSVRVEYEERDDELYAQAEKEVDSGNINQGMWSRALVNANGKEELRKVEYMKLRVRQLKKK